MQTDCGRPHQRHQAANQQASNRTENWNHSHVRAAQARTCSLPRCDPLATRDSARCCWDSHTHTHTHFQVQGLEKGVSENEAPGPVGAVHNNTQRHNNTDAESHSPNLIHRTEIRMSHAGCRGYIGRQEHPETQSNTRTYGTKKSSYVHAYIGRDGKWRKRVQT